MELGSQLARRERQIMDIVFARGKASSTDILAELPDPPTRGALRIMLRILEDKGHLVHHKVGREAVAAHLAQRDIDLSDEELRQLAKLIQEARDKGR